VQFRYFSNTPHITKPDVRYGFRIRRSKKCIRL